MTSVRRRLNCVPRSRSAMASRPELAVVTVASGKKVGGTRRR
jgi:hypothetical protein